MEFKRASKSQAKLRLALTGPSGSGKTFTALAVGSKLGKTLAVIDTERSSSSLYADKFTFDQLDLPDFEPETYIGAIAAAKNAGFEVLIIDSLSHAWEALKDRVDPIAKARYRGNSWAAWSELTPLQNELIQSILQYPGHVIATMRTKTEWTTEKDEKSGRSKPVKVGLAPIQRDGVDYEMTIVLEMSDGGLAKVGKTRWSEIEGRVIEKPGDKFAAGLLKWLDSGSPQKQPIPHVPAPAAAEVALTASAAASPSIPGRLTAAMDAPGSPFAPGPEETPVVDVKTGEIVGYKSEGNAETAGAFPAEATGPGVRSVTTAPGPVAVTPDAAVAPEAALRLMSQPTVPEVLDRIGQNQTVHATDLLREFAKAPDEPSAACSPILNLLTPIYGDEVNVLWRKAGGQMTGGAQKPRRKPLTPRQCLAIVMTLLPNEEKPDEPESAPSVADPSVSKAVASLPDAGF